MIAVDTGMNRIGVHPEDVPALWEKLESLPHLHIRGTFTHMATADHKEKTRLSPSLTASRKPFPI